MLTKRFKRILSLITILALVVGTFMVATGGEARAQEDSGVTIYDLAADPLVQGLEMGATGGAVLATPFLQQSGSPTFTVVERECTVNPDPSRAIQVSNRADSWHTIDLLRAPLGLQLGYTYTIQVTGRIPDAPTGTQFIIGGPVSPWGWLANAAPGGDGRFSVTLNVNAEILNDPQVAGAFRLQTNNNATYIIDNIIVIQTGEEDFTPPQPGNFVFEQDFEEDMVGFVGRDATISRTNVVAHEGNYSLAVTNLQDVSWAGASIPVTTLLEPDTLYMLRAFVRSSIDTPVDISINGEFGETEAVTNRWPRFGQVTVPNSNEWVELRVTFETPSDFGGLFNLNFEISQREVDFYIDTVTIAETYELGVIYSLRYDEDIQALALGTTGLGGTFPFSSSLRNSGTPTYTIVENPAGGNSIQLSNRLQNWYALDIDRPSLGMGSTNTYTIEVSGRVLGSAPFSGAMTIGGADSPWSALASTSISSNGTFSVTLNAPPSIINQSQVANAFRIQFNDNLANFIVDEITVTRTALGDGGDYDIHGGIDLTLTPLHEIWEDYFIMGNIYTPQFPLDRRGDLLAHHFNSITAENIMKPDAMQPQQGNFPFLVEGSDQNNMMDFAVANNQEVIGHTLVWHSQSFPWFEGLNPSREEAIEIMQTHIRTVIGHFNDRNPGLITGWDVVNEAIVPRNGVDPQDWRLHLRNTKWYRAIGCDYIEIAFRTAHEMDPDAILYYNDYNDHDAFKATIIAAMIQELRDDGVPIHRVGMQGHYNSQTPMGSVRNSVERFREITGCETLPPIGISFTEVDITFGGHETAARLPRELEIRQAQMYAQLMQIARDHSDVVHRITFWGMADPDSWRADRFPNIFHGDLSAKYAFHAVADPDGFLEEFPIEATPEPQTTYAPFAVDGPPVVGEFEVAAYGDAPVIPVVNQMTAHNGATAQARVVWYDDAIYILADINDSTPSVGAAAAHEQDSLEIFISNTNSRSYHYEEGDFQLRFNRAGVHTSGSTGSVTGLTFAVVDHGGSYQVEVRIPLENQAAPGRILGFDLQVNDAWGTPPARQAFAKWNDHTDMSWQNTIYWGNLKLLGDEDVAEEITVTFDPTGGTVNPTSRVVAVGETFGGAFPMPTRPGYVFQGWFTAAEDGDRVRGTDTVTQTTDITLFAHWRGENSIIVTFNPTGGTVTEASRTVVMGETFGGAFRMPTRPGYVFMGWFTERTGGARILGTNTVTQTFNFTLFAQWRPENSIVVTFNPNGGTTTETSRVAIPGAENFGGAFRMPTRPGYIFMGWFTARVGGDRILGTNPVTQDSNFTLFARWRPEGSIIVTFNPNGGVVTETSRAVMPGETFGGAFHMPTRPGYIFTGWFTARVGGDRIRGTDEVTQTSNFTLFAQWRREGSIIVTFNPTGGTVTETSRAVVPGETFGGAFRMPTRPGYTFTGWFTAAVGGDRIRGTDEVRHVSNFTLFAQWRADNAGFTTIEAP